MVDSKLLASVSTPSFFGSNLAEKILVGSSGASGFTRNQPEITFIYPNKVLQTIYDISVPMDTSNVRQIEVSYIVSTDGSTLLTDANGNIIRDQSPMNNPKVTLNPPRQGLYGFVVKILATSDNSTPKKVTVMANGCQRSSRILKK